MPMLTTLDLSAARGWVDRNGGWLLRDDAGGYFATDDEGLVCDLRGREFIAECERRHVWDETRILEIDAIIRRAATDAIRGTSYSYGLAREVAERIASQSEADGVPFDAELLADAALDELADIVGDTLDRLADDGWIERDQRVN